MRFVFMDKVRIGLIGLGHLGRFHLKNLLEIKNCEISGVYDIDEKKLKSVSAENSVKAFDSINELFKESDAVLGTGKGTEDTGNIREHLKVQQQIYFFRPGSAYNPASCHNNRKQAGIINREDMVNQVDLL